MNHVANAFALIASLSTAAIANEPPLVVAGWTLGDPPSPTDNGSRTVGQISKTASGVTITYVAFDSADGDGGSIATDFAATTTCRDQWYGARLTFDDPALAPEAAVRSEVHDAFVKYAQKCGAPPIGESTLMQGFGDAFHALGLRAATAK